MTQVLTYAGWFAGVAAGLAGLGWIVAKAWRGLRKLGHFIDDVAGEPARAGAPGRRSLMERVAVIEAEVRTNGGGSLKDAVVRIETKVDTAAAKVEALEKRVP